MDENQLEPNFQEVQSVVDILTPNQISTNLDLAARAYLTADYSDSSKEFREEHDSLIFKVNHRNWRALRECNNTYTLVKLVCTFMHRIKSTIFTSDAQIKVLLTELKDFIDHPKRDFPESLYS